MTTQTETDADKIKAFKILHLNEELEEIEKKKKTITKAFTEERKRIKGEIKAVLSGESTNKEIVDGVGDIHDLADIQ